MTKVIWNLFFYDLSSLVVTLLPLTNANKDPATMHE